MKGEPETGAALVNHLGLWGKDLDSTRAKLDAAGIPTKPKAQFIDLPNGVRLEFIDDGLPDGQFFRRTPHHVGDGFGVLCPNDAGGYYQHQGQEEGGQKSFLVHGGLL